MVREELQAFKQKWIDMQSEKWAFCLRRGQEFPLEELRDLGREELRDLEWEGVTYKALTDEMHKVMATKQIGASGNLKALELSLANPHTEIKIRSNTRIGLVVDALLVLQSGIFDDEKTHTKEVLQ